MCRTFPCFAEVEYGFEVLVEKCFGGLRNRLILVVVHEQYVSVKYIKN